MKALPAALLLLPGAAHGHGFGQRYDLPLPLWLFLCGAGLVVMATFALLARQRGAPAPRARYSRPVLAQVPGRRALGLLLRLAVLALYLLVIVAGFVGPQSPLRNIAPAMVWAVWWVGMAYVSALVGDLWALVNPVDTVFRFIEMVFKAITGRRLRAPLHYRLRWGVWPAVLLFFVFAWMELAWEGGERPASLATAILAYGLVCWCGMALFGRAAWLRHGDVFAIVFGLLARFSPNTVREGQWQVRPYGAGLLAHTPAPASMVMLVMALLATVSFDGLLETQAWLDLVGALAARLPAWAAPAIPIAALLLLPLLFLGVFLLCCRLIAGMGSAGPSRPSTGETAGRYVLTLVPIAIAYHFAHYLSFLALAVQYLIPLASDPFGLGWDLFGTRLYFIRIGIIDARMVWYVSLFAIVAAHVAAVWLAHVTAQRQCASRALAQRSQYPMLALMVGYTLLSLWIIAQPIVA